MTIRLSAQIQRSKYNPTSKCLFVAVMSLLTCSAIGQNERAGAVSNPIERARHTASQNDKRVTDVPGIQSEEENTAPAAEKENTASTDEPLNADDETISLNVDNQEARIILRNIAELFELNIVIPDDLIGSTSLNLKDVTWQQVFDLVLEEQGYSWAEVNGIIRIRQGGTDGDDAIDTRVQLLSNGNIKVDFRSTPVDNILSSIANALDLNVVIPPAEELANELDLRLNDVAWEQVYRVALAQFGYGYIDSDGIIMIRSLDQINGVPDVSRVFQVKYSEAVSIANLLKEQGGVTRVVTDPRSNVIIVTGNPSRFSEIKSLIDTLDRPTPQVMIESRFVEVSNNDTSQVGLDWASLFSEDGYKLSGQGESVSNKDTRNENNGRDESNSDFTSSNQVSGGTNTAASTVESTINQFKNLIDSTVSTRSDTAIFTAPAFNLVLRALKKLDDSKIVSNPTVLALNGQKAEIKVIDHYHIQEPGTVSEDGRVVPGEVRKIDPLPGIELEVTPTISGGDFISLKVVPQVNDIVKEQVFQGTPVPVVRQRTTLTQVMVKDRETLAIGGLMDEKTFQNESKIPILGSIPALGRLFRYQKDTTESKNQIIFITASILNPNEINYIDVVGADRMNQLGLTDRDVSGFNHQGSAEERALNDAIMNYRRKIDQQKREDNLSLQLEAYRKLEEERALKALKELEKISDFDFDADDNGSESASAMEQLKGGKRGSRPMPLF